MVSVQLNPNTMERLKKLKSHNREPHDETINMLIDEHENKENIHDLHLVDKEEAK